MATKSMIEAAYDIMSNKKRAVAFAKLWEDVAKQTGANNDAVAQFYSDLTLDGRFVQLKDNKWDLKSHRKFSETHIDLSEIELDDEEENEDGYVEDDDMPIRNNEDEY